VLYKSRNYTNIADVKSGTKQKQARKQYRRHPVSLFKQLRLARGVGRRDLANAVGCSCFSVDQWDTGDRVPSAKWYPALAEELRVPQLVMPKLFDKKFKGVSLESLVSN
jgi:DNA-binding transcriptional regulator YiaG